MTRQEIFDMALNGIRRQGEPAFYNETCSYYALDTGNRCAAGQLLDKEAAKKLAETGMGKWFNHNTSEDIMQEIRKIDIPDYLLTEDNIDFVKRIQNCHDYAAKNIPNNKRFMSEFEKRMEEVAINHGLIYTQSEQ